MKPVFKKPQLVRGVVVVSSRYDGLVSKDNDNCAIARTLWYRHDDDLAELEREVTSLARILLSSSKGCSMTLAYEYKDYI